MYFFKVLFVASDNYIVSILDSTDILKYILKVRTLGTKCQKHICFIIRKDFREMMVKYVKISFYLLCSELFS